MLRDALMETPSGEDERVAQERMRQMHAFIELMTDWLDEVQKMDSATLASLMKMGAKVQKLLEMKDKVKQVFGMSTTPADSVAVDPPHAVPVDALAPPSSPPENLKKEH